MSATEYQGADQHLRDAEEKLFAVTDAIAVPIMVFAPDGTTLYANRLTLELTGIPASEVYKGGLLARACHPDDLPRVREERRLGLEAGVSFQIEMRLLRYGEHRWQLAQYQPVKNERGRVIRWYATAIDIQDRKHADQKLRQSEEDLRAITDAIANPIIVLNPEGTTLYVNRVALDVTGRTWEEMRGKAFFASVVHPDDLERFRDGRQEGFSRGAPFELQVRASLKEGGYRWYLMQYNPFKDERGQIIRWYGTATNIDDQKKMEERLRTEIESRKQEEERVRQENVRLEERTRIARELHDTLLQTVQSASMHLGAALYGVAEDSSAKPRLERILQLMGQAVEESRSAIHGLRSSDADSSDLVLALSRIKEDLKVETDIDFHLTVRGRQRRWPSQIQDEIYRIGREALVNAFFHSGAKRVELNLEFSDSELRMQIRDNGCGIDPPVLEKGRDGHWGLAGMRERAIRIGGLFNILSSPTAGTEVQLSIPSPAGSRAFPFAS